MKLSTLRLRDDLLALAEEFRRQNSPGPGRELSDRQICLAMGLNQAYMASLRKWDGGPLESPTMGKLILFEAALKRKLGSKFHAAFMKARAEAAFAEDDPDG